MSKKRAPSGIEQALSNGEFFQVVVKKFWKYLDRICANIYNFFKFKTQPIDQKKIIFLTSRGTYNCHPRAIADEIIRQKLPYKMIWAIRKSNIENNDTYPKEIKTVLRNSYEFNRESATAKVWIDNSVTFSYLYAKKRKKQVLFETWHGSFGLKRFDDNNNKYWIKKAKEEGKQTDYILTNCKFEENLFKDTFWENAEALPYGHPRNDILFKDNIEIEEIRKSLRKRFSICEDTHIILYAPTYRDDGSNNVCNLDYEGVTNALENRFGGKWKIMVRYHFLDKKLGHINEKDEHVINATDYPDIQDLMLITDVGLTDYSSWIYDYFFTEKPCFLFVPDIDDYVEKDREFLFPLDTTPFPIAKTNEALIENIKNFDIENYKTNYDRFSADMACYEDGHAAERVVEKLKEIMG